MNLVVDTETTGKADFKAPPEAEHQPRIVQLGALLEDDNGKEVASINLIVSPDGFEISDEVAAIHGIDQVKAVCYGVAIRRVMLLFADLWACADKVVAHNIDFDLFMLDIEYSRLKLPKWGEERPCYCTMKLMTNICQLPLKYAPRSGEKEWKWPNMQEAHQKACGCNFDGGHDAMADVRACGRVFRWLCENGHIK